jgi:hypothetical protein
MKKCYFFSKRLLFLTLLLAGLFISLIVEARLYPFSATYSGTQEVPANNSPATGTISGVYNDFTNTIHYTITFSGLTAPTNNAHFHGPGAPGIIAPVVIGHAGFPLGVTAGTYSKSDVLTDAQETQLLAGLWYSNIHTTAIPAGEIRAQINLAPASDLVYAINNTYAGTQEVPPNNSPGTGTIVGAYNSMTNTIFYTITFSGLSAPTNNAHFHGPGAPGVIAPVVIGHAGFPLGVTSGTYSKSDVLSDLFETQLLANLWYSNIHTTAIPAGEIRAQITPMVAANITCPANITVSNTPGLCSATVSFAATATGLPAPTIQYRIGNTVITSPRLFPVGTTTVTATATNSAGVASCSFNVTVNDTEAPVVSAVTPSTQMLWPPNHKMWDVMLSYTSTDNCAVTGCQVTVTSNESVNGPGNNNSPDWVIVNNQHIRLRAERNGNGDGRIYTITVTCRDAAGNSTSRMTTVSVPHSMSSARASNEFEQLVGDKALSMVIMPNPTTSYFTVNLTTESAESMNLRVFDITGRTILTRNNLSGTQALRLGEQFKPGVYFVELRQGEISRQLKLVKM